MFIANVSSHRPQLSSQACSLEHEHIILSKETQDSRRCLANGLRGQSFCTQFETRATDSLERWRMEIFYPENSRGGSKMLSAQISLQSCSSGLANKQVETGDTRKQRRVPKILAVSFVELPTATTGCPSTARVEEEVIWARATGPARAPRRGGGGGSGTRGEERNNSKPQTLGTALGLPWIAWWHRWHFPGCTSLSQQWLSFEGEKQG